MRKANSSTDNCIVILNYSIKTGTRGRTAGKNLHILLAYVYLMYTKMFSYDLDLYIQKSNKIWILLLVLRNEIQKRYIYSGHHSVCYHREGYGKSSRTYVSESSSRIHILSAQWMPPLKSCSWVICQTIMDAYVYDLLVVYIPNSKCLETSSHQPYQVSIIISIWWVTKWLIQNVQPLNIYVCSVLGAVDDKDKIFELFGKLWHEMSVNNTKYPVLSTKLGIHSYKRVSKQREFF